MHVNNTKWTQHAIFMHLLIYDCLYINIKQYKRGYESEDRKGNMEVSTGRRMAKLILYLK